MSDNAELRRRGLNARAKLSPAYRRHASELICQRIANSKLFRRSRCIGAYLPLRTEVDVFPLIEICWRSGKSVVVPVVTSDNRMVFAHYRETTRLVRNRLNFAQPGGSNRKFSFTNEIDLIVAPLAAFDPNAARIGMGGGYYDRTFARLRSPENWRHSKLIGAAFEVQQAELIRPANWDVKMHRIITEIDEYPVTMRFSDTS